MRSIIAVILCLHLLVVQAETIAPKDPFSYTLKYYAMIVFVAVFGGIAAWWGKVRSGQYPITSISAFVGEVMISAFSGLITFFLCEWQGYHPLLTAGLVGISGHMGTRGIMLLESWAASRYPILPGKDSK